MQREAKDEIDPEIPDRDLPEMMSFKLANNRHIKCTVNPAQTTTSIKQPMLSPPKPIPIQSLLYKTTTYLTLPVTSI